MKISFDIHYFTHWGQQIAVCGNIPELGNLDPQQALPLNYQIDGRWQRTIEVTGFNGKLDYFYVLLDEQATGPTPEWGQPRQLRVGKSRNWVLCKDSWRANGSVEIPFYTSAFQEVIFTPGDFATKSVRKPKDKKILRLQLHAPAIPAGKRLGVIGNLPEFGSWDASKPLLFGNEAHPLWTLSVALDFFETLEYKYGIYEPGTGELLELEGGPNRKIFLTEASMADELLRTDEYYERARGHWKGAGLAIPVFSIRTKDGLGTGEFNDIKKLIDWAVKTGLKMVQILPVNDTSANKTWMDSYPYSAISVFALHPLFLHLEALGDTDKVLGPGELDNLRAELNKLDTVDYEAVMRIKLRLAREIFEVQKADFVNDKAFKQYFKENKEWLQHYALFCYFRDEFNTADFSKWKDKAVYSDKLLKEYCDPKAEDYDEILFFYYLQFHLDKQLQEATAYARENGIVLKGDLPIGIYRHSVDAWVAPELYNMDAQAGAPPDPFSDNGQNWGFPTYNWTEMAKDGYLWWRNRMKQLTRYFDAYRIDHILGFFRIWQIPTQHVDGLLGFFNPAIPVTEAELQGRGINFDYHRYCEPYLPENLIMETFGDDAAYVREHFLEGGDYGMYNFKAAVNTQRKIEAFFQDAAHAEKEGLKEELYKLTGEVLFITEERETGVVYHPRIEWWKTRSFQDLDGYTKEKLSILYHDYFYVRQNEFWREQAMEKLPALKDATDMLICGEDLGMVPASVPGVMRDLGIVSLEIQRMSKNPETEFLQLPDIPYLSVASPSTHDMSPIRAWWEEEDWASIQRFYEQELHFSGEHPFFCEPWIAQAIINQHLRFPSMWTVFPLQDLLAMDEEIRRQNPHEERINVPANPKHYWRYRMHLNVEELLEEDKFNLMLRIMLENSDRA